MQEIRSSNPPVDTGICDPSKSRARHHRIFMLLLYLWNSDMGKFFMKANKKKNQIQNLVSIRKIAEKPNPVIVKNILFIHAWSCCDSTWVVFNKGKTALMKLIAKEDREVLDICSIFHKTSATPQEIRKVGENCL